MIPTLNMYLLGDFLLVSGDTPVTTINVPRLQSLLAYLVLHRSAPQDRSHLAFLLWPDSTEAQAHSNLRKLLHQLRQALPHADYFLHADRQSLHWLPEQSQPFWTLDVLDFEQAIAWAEQAERVPDMAATRQALERAVYLYRGELLPSCYDEWILPERDRLCQLFFQAAERLIELLEQDRDYEAAIKVAQRVIRHDSLQETTYRQLMRLYALRGNRVAALRVYHTCAALLERELGMEPSEATRQVYESILRSDTSTQPVTGPLSPRGTEAPLVGRKAEWQQLQEAWHKAAKGRPRIAMLSGEVGIGKTRLAEEMEAWVSRQGMTTASARCYAVGGRLAYAPVTTWLRTEAIQTGLPTLDDVWLTEVARLVPDLLTQRPNLPRPAPMVEGWQRQHFFEALACALLSARQPLLLLLDDLQWCDNETLEWVHYLLHFASQARLLLIGTVRSEEALPGHPLVSFLSSLQRDGIVTEIALRPLDPAESAILAEHVMGHELDPVMISNLQRETEGNPLFVVEMMRSGTLEQYSREQQRVDTPHAFLAQPASKLPSMVQTVLTARLAQLSPSARELANVAAVIGREFSWAVLARASGEDEEALVRGLDELWQRRIVREQGGEAYDFSHDKLREEAYTSLSITRRRFLHRRVAEALEGIYASSMDAVSNQIAAHHEHAGLPERAVPYYQRTAEVAQRVYANEEAIKALQRAAALLEAGSQHERSWEAAASVYEQLGDVLDVTGKHIDARQAYEQAMNRVTAQAEVWQARLQRKIALTWQHPPNPEKALQSYRTAEHILEQAAIKAEPAWKHEWMQTQIEQLQPLFMLARAQEMTRVIKKAQTAIEQYGTAAQRALFYRHIALRDVVRDHYVVSEETVDRCRMALETSKETGLLQLEGLATFGLGYCLLLCGNLDEAEEQLQAGAALGERMGDAELYARCLAFLSLVFRRRGQVEEVRDYISRETKYTNVITANHAWLAWRDGNLEETEMYGQAAMELWQHQRYVYALQWTGLWPLIGVALSKERLAEAMNYVRILLAPTQQRPPEILYPLLEASVQAWDRGQKDSANMLLREALPLAREMGYL